MLDGYIREFQDGFKDIIIPREINNICFNFFFYVMDKFCVKLSGANMKISEDRYRATFQPDSSGHSGAQSLFGDKEIESMDNDFVYIWKLQIINRIGFFAVGLTSAFIHKTSSFSDYPNSYYFNAGFGSLARNHLDDGEDIVQWQYAPALKSNDIIEIHFDVGRGYISYCINGQKIDKKSTFNLSQEENVAFSDIVKRTDIKYRMGLCFNAVGASIKILSFSVN